jgi:hypothetical protein
MLKGAKPRPSRHVTFWSRRNKRSWSLLTGVTFVAIASLLSVPAYASLASRVLLPPEAGTDWLSNLRPPDPFCAWTRLQVPTTMGLRWVAEENCDQDGG